MAAGMFTGTEKLGIPAAIHTFVIGSGSVTVEDSDGDDLPTASRTLPASPAMESPARPACVRWRGRQGSDFSSDQVATTNRCRRAVAAALSDDTSRLNQPLRPTVALRAAILYDTATHVHCARKEMPRKNTATLMVFREIPMPAQYELKRGCRDADGRSEPGLLRSSCRECRQDW